MSAVEHWRPIAGYEGLYEVCDLGRVRRVPGWIEYARRAGKRSVLRRIRRWVRGGLMKQGPGPGGYARVSLNREHRLKPAAVHLLVARAFLGEPPTGHEVNHRDGDRMNARLDNLEYLTTGANISHGWRELGRLAKVNERYEAIPSTPGTHRNTGERNGLAKLNEATVREMRTLYASGRVTSRELAERFGIGAVTAYYAISRKTWRHVE